VSKPILAALNDPSIRSSRVADGHISVPWYGRGNATDERIVLDPDSSIHELSTIGYFWTIDSKPTEKSQDNDAWADFDPFYVMGDSKFTVVCGYSGYVVWCFDKDIKLSAGDY
jgi:hypothetical protein